MCTMKLIMFFFPFTLVLLGTLVYGQQMNGDAVGLPSVYERIVQLSVSSPALVQILDEMGQIKQLLDSNVSSVSFLACAAAAAVPVMIDPVSIAYHVIINFTFPWTAAMPMTLKTMVNDSSLELVAGSGSEFGSIGNGLSRARLMSNPILCSNGLLIMLDRTLHLPQSLESTLIAKQAGAFLIMLQDHKLIVKGSYTILVPPANLVTLMKQVTRSKQLAWLKRLLIPGSTIILAQNFEASSSYQTLDPAFRISLQIQNSSFRIRGEDDHVCETGVLESNIHFEQGGVVHLVDSLLLDPLRDIQVDDISSSLSHHESSFLSGVLLIIVVLWIC